MWKLNPATGTCDIPAYSVINPATPPATPDKVTSRLITAGDYAYFVSTWSPLQQDIVITVEATAGDPDIFVGPANGALPTKESHTWSAVARGSDSLEIVWGDFSLTAGDYIIGVRAAGELRANPFFFFFFFFFHFFFIFSLFFFLFHFHIFDFFLLTHPSKPHIAPSPLRNDTQDRRDLLDQRDVPRHRARSGDCVVPLRRVQQARHVRQERDPCRVHGLRRRVPRDRVPD
jgi:hypothetical protein